MITWTPIAQLPDELKDGREVLLWLGKDGPTLASWVDYSGGGYVPEGEFANWSDERGPLGHLTVTHFAQITPPDEPVQQFAYVRDPANPEAPPMEIPWGEMTVGTKFTVQDWPKPGCNRFEVVDGVPPLKSPPLP
jgi:hypothetical protein